MMLPEELCNEILRDNYSVEVKRVLVAVLTDLDSAQAKFPEWPKDHIHKAAIVAEEAGELVQAALKHRYEGGRYYDMHSEALQTAAMAIRFLLSTPRLKLLSTPKLKGENHG